jgi:hypothetical protein
MPSFDPGPPAAWAATFDLAPLNDYSNHPSGRFRTEFGPVYYRGRLDGTARVLVVGQDPSTDESLAQRTFVGRAGQRVQGLLAKLGLTHDYVMLNAFLFGITDQFNTAMRTISASAPFLDYRNGLFDQVAATNPLAAVIAFGAGARHAVSLWPGRGALPLFELVHPTAPNGVTASWNAQLAPLLVAIPPEPGQVPDATPYGAQLTDADQAAIPRGDLPFGLPDWHGTDGTRSKRQGARTIVWSLDNA